MSEKRYKEILDESSQLIQVADLETFQMMYANRPAMEYTGHANMPYLGENCYQYMMGLSEQCPFCPMKLMEKGDISKETEIDNGVQVYKVKTVVTEWNGKPAFIEYATDVTLARRAQEIYSGDMTRLLHSIPEARGIYHLNLTQNTSKYLRTETIRDEADTVDKIIKAISELIASPREAELFRLQFDRKQLMSAFEQGKNDVVMEVVCGESSVGEDDNHWVRITARNIINPSSGDLESFLYVVDVSNQKNLEELAAKDQLTGLYHKKYFEKTVREALAKHQTQSKALVFLDVDHFKAINDTFGHLVGDILLSNVAEKLQSIFSDLDIISRFGGDEFCVYLEDITQSKLLEKLERFKMRLLAPEEEGEKVGVTCSIGVAYFSGTKALQFEDAMNQADTALYQAKNTGRNKIVISNENL